MEQPIFSHRSRYRKWHSSWSRIQRRRSSDNCMDLDGNKMVGLVNPIIMTVETVWETPIITGFVHRNSCAAWQQSRCNCDPSSGAWHSRAIWCCCRYRVRARRNKDQTIPAHHKNAKALKQRKSRPQIPPEELHDDWIYVCTTDYTGIVELHRDQETEEPQSKHQSQKPERPALGAKDQETTENRYQRKTKRPVRTVNTDSLIARLALCVFVPAFALILQWFSRRFPCLSTKAANTPSRRSPPDISEVVSMVCLCGIFGPWRW